MSATAEKLPEPVTTGQLQALVNVDATPATLSVNFEQVKAEVARYLKRYEIEVTADTVKSAKELAAELNKTVKALDDRRKAEIAKVTAQVEPFDAQMRELVQMTKDGVQSIRAQVQVYEDKTRDYCAELLADTRAGLYEALEVDDYYRSTEFDDLIKLTSLTSTGNLNSKARETLTQRVQADKARQTKVENRILRAENEGHKAGLTAPVGRAQIRHLLNADDAAFEEGLAEVISNELDREQQAEQRRAQAAERAERARAQVATTPSPRPAPEQPTAPEVSRSVPAAVEPPPAQEDEDIAPPAPGYVHRRVVATFLTEVPANVSDDRISAKLRSMIEAAGITSLSSIEVQHVN